MFPRGVCPEARTPETRVGAVSSGVEMKTLPVNYRYQLSFHFLATRSSCTSLAEFTAAATMVRVALGCPARAARRWSARSW